MKGWMKITAVRTPDLGGDNEYQTGELARIREFTHRYPTIPVTYTNIKGEDVLLEKVDIWIEAEIDVR